MKRIFIFSVLLFTASNLISQSNDSLKHVYINTDERLLSTEGNLLIGGYGEVHFNLPVTPNVYDASILDVHRVVMFLGYNFSRNTQFVSEIEFEYAKEIWVEQAFIQQRLSKFINFRAGLLLIPMGIINEYHEPTTFNGVERPIIDNKIAPTTWREIGMGLSGDIDPIYTRYQLYVVNGMNGYDTKGLFSGSKTLRDGRQKGSKSYMTSPNFAGRVEYYGIYNLNVGLSGYYGKSQSKLYQNLSKDSAAMIETADSSVVGISMVGADLRYAIKGFRFTSQLYYINLSNTEEYNKFTAHNGILNDLGSSMIGYYAEIGYNVFQPFAEIKTELMPFIRYEKYNTHHTVDNLITVNKIYDNTIITTGVTLKLIKGAVLKTDFQFSRSAANNKYLKVFNAGFGVVF